MEIIAGDILTKQKIYENAVYLLLRHCNSKTGKAKVKRTHLIVTWLTPGVWEKYIKGLQMLTHLYCILQYSYTYAIDVKLKTLTSTNFIHLNQAKLYQLFWKDVEFQLSKLHFSLTHLISIVYFMPYIIVYNL